MMFLQEQNFDCIDCADQVFAQAKRMKVQPSKEIESKYATFLIIAKEYVHEHGMPARTSGISVLPQVMGETWRDAILTEKAVNNQKKMPFLIPINGQPYERFKFDAATETSFEERRYKYNKNGGKARLMTDMKENESPLEMVDENMVFDGGLMQMRSRQPIPMSSPNAFNVPFFCFLFEYEFCFL